MPQQNVVPAIILGGLAVACIAYVAFKSLASMLGVDAATLVSMIRLAVLAAILVTGLAIFRLPTLAITALLAGLWVVFWPALDYWAQSDFERNLGYALDLPWWATSYCKWSFLAIIVVAGSSVHWYVKDRTYSNYGY